MSEMLEKWLKSENPVAFIFKVMLGLVFDLGLLQVMMPDFMAQPFIPVGIEFTREYAIVIAIAFCGFIFSGWTSFMFFFGFPYLAFKKWVLKR